MINPLQYYCKNIASLCPQSHGESGQRIIFIIFGTTDLCSENLNHCSKKDNESNRNSRRPYYKQEYHWYHLTSLETLNSFFFFPTCAHNTLNACLLNTPFHIFEVLNVSICKNGDVYSLSMTANGKGKIMHQ